MNGGICVMGMVGYGCHGNGGIWVSWEWWDMGVMGMVGYGCHETHLTTLITPRQVYANEMPAGLC